MKQKLGIAMIAAPLMAVLIGGCVADGSLKPLIITALVMAALAWIWIAVSLTLGDA